MRNKLIIAGGLIILGTCWWVTWNEIDRETRKKVSDCPGGVSNAQEKAFKSELEVLYKRTQAVEAQHKTRKDKPVKVYQGKWRKDYLEIVKR